ncbi:MAG: alpha/beta fold hydrolase [Rhodobacteraceae bacterium]|nr:MAG: alpha/beta fold hydrolase [Paracoccaceae bacterium]
MLNQIHHGQPGGTPLVIVHGLYGSARNWSVIAKRLADRGHVVAVDLRNHGDSPHRDSHSYADMADDLAEVVDSLGGKADIAGHSMGGKAAMVLALAHPGMVNRLVVGDIAPVAYDHDQTQFIDAMQAVDLDRVTKRADATEQLSAHVEDRTLQSFFTQSLDLAGKRWKLNLEVLKREMDKIIGFPDLSGVYDGPTLFLSGALSDYVLPEHRPAIRRHFPKARFAKLVGAGHWLHADKPREFEASLRAFLDA